MYYLEQFLLMNFHILFSNHIIVKINQENYENIYKNW